MLRGMVSEAMVAGEVPEWAEATEATEDGKGLVNTTNVGPVGIDLHGSWTAGLFFYTKLSDVVPNISTNARITCSGSSINPIWPLFSSRTTLAWGARVTSLSNTSTGI